MWDPEKGAAHQAGFEPFVSNVAANTLAFGRPVLMFNGDSHVFRSDNPLSAADPLNYMHPGYDVTELSSRRRARQHPAARVLAREGRRQGELAHECQRVRALQLGRGGRPLDCAELQAGHATALRTRVNACVARVSGSASTSSGRSASRRGGADVPLRQG